MSDRLILTDADLLDRWSLGSAATLARHRDRGLRGFRVATKGKVRAPGQACWRYRLADVEAYEARLIAEAQPLDPRTLAVAPPMEGWDGVTRARKPKGEAPAAS